MITVVWALGLQKRESRNRKEHPSSLPGDTLCLQLFAPGSLTRRSRTWSALTSLPHPRKGGSTRGLWSVGSAHPSHTVFSTLTSLAPWAPLLRRCLGLL